MTAQTTTWDARARARLGTWLFLGASSVLFLMLLTGFVTFHDAAALRNLNITTGSALTVMILSSASALGLATKGQGRAVMCLVTGAIFLAIQIGDARRLMSHNITVAASPFDSAWFTLIGMHALYVLAGLLGTGLFVVFQGRPGFRSGRRGERRAATLSALSLYWYFLAAVWVLIFVVAYLGGAS